MADQGSYDFIDLDLPGDDILGILGELPRRWGRMDRLSRLAVVEVGRTLRQAGILVNGEAGLSVTGKGGLIGITRRGSLDTDLAYAETLKQGVDMASPTLFSYTLPNIALAEAASHYGLTGPVFSLFDDQLRIDAEKEAKSWLTDDGSLDFMVAGIIDLYPDPADRITGTIEQPHDPAVIISVNFTYVS